MRTLLLGLIALAVACPAFADVHVNGYYKQNETYVAPHERSDPDGDKSNNWSHEGNVNPYTGKEGHKKD
jgi:hypothetical protein